MKKVITICLLVITLLAGGMTAEAKTTKKKSKTKSNSSAICKFKYYDATVGESRYKVTFSLLPNGKVKSTKKCISGVYNKLKGAYHVTLDTDGDKCGDSCWEDLIVGNYIYSIGGGTGDDTIHEFTFNPSDNTVTIINSSDMSDREFMKWNNLPSLKVPLSHFEKVGTVTWMK